MKPESYVFNDSFDPLASAAVCVFVCMILLKVYMHFVSFKKKVNEEGKQIKC